MDDFDRKILAALTDDALVSYEALGRQVGLSAPAVHARVKKLRESGTIKRSTVMVDPVLAGKPFLAFVSVDFAGWGKTKQLMELSRFPEVEEMHSIAGESGMLLKVRTRDAHGLELFLAQLYECEGVQTTRSNIVLSTFLERGVQAAHTENWPVEVLVKG